ncbi:MAG: GGDEF domain-containing protein [Rhodoferax sp.]|nr:GGDEF domain-containing protein [Rhodoferax sp.]MCF8209105.1 GGDEF domain-containing protein [Rhodoferax sp.]
MTSAPRLLDQIANLTAIRDLELIEFSLLKTLKGFLQPRGLSLVRLGSNGLPTMEISFGVEKNTVKHDNLTLSPEVQAADEFLRASDSQFHSSRVTEGLLIIFPLMSTRTGRNYLQIVVDGELSKMDQHMVAGVLQIYRNFVSVIQHSQTDQLTGLANRKTFDECVARVHELIQPENENISDDRRGATHLSYWLVMVDIDHFKSVNDRFGHLYGDEVLVLLAQTMQTSFRENDLIFRFGGEEFVLIIRCADHAACLTTLERFRVKVEQRSIPQVGHITVSMGVTQMERSTFAATMVDHADQALYHSKRNGRNQVTFYEDLVAQGLVVVEEIQTDEISFF